MRNFPPDHEHIDPNMLKVEVNLDDSPGEWLGYLMDKLFAAGANDVYYTPIYMKKNRPGIQLQVLCSDIDFKEIKQILLTETTTLGIRYYPLTVFRMERRVRFVETKWGMIKVKEGWQNEALVKSSPEYEDCRKIAENFDVPLKDVYQEVWKNL